MFVDCVYLTVSDNNVNNVSSHNDHVGHGHEVVKFRYISFIKARNRFYFDQISTKVALFKFLFSNTH